MGGFFGVKKLNREGRKGNPIYIALISFPLPSSKRSLQLPWHRWRRTRARKNQRRKWRRYGFLVGASSSLAFEFHSRKVSSFMIMDVVCQWQPGRAGRTERNTNISGVPPLGPSYKASLTEQNTNTRKRKSRRRLHIRRSTRSVERSHVSRSLHLPLPQTRGRKCVTHVCKYHPRSLWRWPNERSWKIEMRTFDWTAVYRRWSICIKL